MGAGSYFPANYREGRAAFIKAADKLGMDITTRVHPGAKGPRGRPLFMDVACAGDRAAKRALMLICIFPTTHDVETNRKYRKALRRLIAESATRGWGEYRTPVAYYDTVMSTYSFGDHALLRFHETVKDALDPNGIVSPGRYGIWPQRNRGGPR